jgi:hypothetical protein
MSFLPFVENFHNSKLIFSKNELRKILSCYSSGVSKGNWKDYAIFFDNHETSFCMFKHSLASPDCILTKTDKSKKNNITYNLQLQNNKKTRFTRIDDLLALLKRREFKIIPTQ